MNIAKLRGATLQALKANIADSQHIQNLHFLCTQSKTFIVDCGALACTTNDEEDFEDGTVQILDRPIIMKGSGGNVEIWKVGILQFQILADNGSITIFYVPAFLTPGAPCLFSPQVFLAMPGDGGEFIIQRDCCKIRVKGGFVVTLPLDPHLRCSTYPYFPMCRRLPTSSPTV